MKYDDVLYYKQLLREEFNVITFVYVRISEELYDILLNELNINTKYTAQVLDIFNYRYQFKYGDTYYLMDNKCKNTQSIFNVLVKGKHPQNNRFAKFDIDVLSENERIIKKLLE
jgi:hypothetical protein